MALGAGAAAAAIVAAAALLHGAAALAESPPRYRPADGGQALLVLPAALGRPAAGGASNADGAARLAAQYLRLARATNDARYFGRAEAAIRPWQDREPASPQVQLVAADLAQQRHDFETARRRLDRVLAADPREPQARLMRANLALLSGEFAAARRDCLGVVAAGAAWPGTICLASAMTGPGSVARARRLAATLAANGRTPPAVLRWKLLTEADLALRAGDADAALELLERAHALDTGHEETRTRLAELLLAQGGLARARDLAAAPNASPARSVVALRAALALGDPRAPALRRALDAALAEGLRRGSQPHDREIALLALHADRDATRALVHARRHFARQRDTADLRLLIDAARAAGDRAALDAARTWLETTGFEDLVADARLREAGA